MRRLPIYILLDTSKSMRGEKIEAVQRGMQTILSALRKNPYALESAYISVITFGSDVKQIVPLTDIIEFQLPVLTTGGATSLGGALKMVAECAEREVQKSTADAKGDWKPRVFLMTDGYPTDDFQSGLDVFKRCKWGNIVACTVGGNADISVLQKITRYVVELDNIDVSMINRYFCLNWSSVGLILEYDISSTYEDWNWDE